MGLQEWRKAEEAEAAGACLQRGFRVRQETALLLCLRERRSSGGEGTKRLSPNVLMI